MPYRVRYSFSFHRHRNSFEKKTPTLSVFFHLPDTDSFKDTKTGYLQVAFINLVIVVTDGHQDGKFPHSRIDLNYLNLFVLDVLFHSTDTR